MSYYNNNYNRNRSVGYQKPRTTYGRQTYGQSGYGNWDWGTYSGVSTRKEEEDNLFIANHDNYFTPTHFEISSRLPYGGNYRTPENIKLIKEMSRFFFHKMLDEKDYIDIQYKDESTMSEEQLDIHSSKKPFYEDLWSQFVPGFTPLEKALSLFNQMAENQKKNGGDEGDVGEKVTEDARAELEAAKFDHDTYTDPEYNELLDMDFFKKKKMSKRNIMNKISLIKNLGSQFKIEKDVTEKIVQNSQIIAKKMMRDYSQVFNVELYQRLFPDFKTKLITKNLTVNVPVEKTEHKQKIIIILDFSGSMSSKYKQEWVLAVLVDRLKYAMKEEAEVFFSYFCSNPNAMKFTHIYDRKTALAFWQQFSTLPNGGGTQVGKMISKIHDEVINNKRLMNLDVDLSEEQPEILVINDGQDSIGTNKFIYKTNAISLYQDNEELKGLCVDNQGKYVTITSDYATGKETANTYSKDGNEKIIL